MREAPQDQVAQDFMARKGYPGIEPYDVTKLEGQDCWYFYYQLPEGALELEVFYDATRRDWQTTVTAFPRRLAT